MSDSSKSLIFPKESRRETMFSEKGQRYPTQTSLGDVSEDLAGEYRGYYPDNTDNATGYWKPRSSTYQGRTGGAHNGVDIYTGYGPFPRETPIYAVTDGRFIPMYDSDRPDRSGNRAAIQTALGNDTVHFRYGHFARFVGASRNVEKGDLIGFAGCSGNADTKGECSQVQNCNLTSCHVHLIAWVNNFSSGKVDPSEILDWQLAHDTDADGIACSDWPARPATPPENPRAEGGLRMSIFEEWRRQGSSRDPLPEPFQHMDFDDTRRLRQAVAAYEDLSARLESQVAANPENQETFGVQFLREMREAWIETPTALKDILSELDHEIAALNAPDEQEWLGGHVARSLLQLRLAGWLVTGGAALRAGMSNRTLRDLWNQSTVAGGQPVSNGSIAGLWLDRLNEDHTDTALPECGASIGGTAHIVASDGGQGAHHRTTLILDNTTEHSVTSFDFGIGSLRHGIWPASLEAEDASHAAEVFVRDVDLALAAIWQAAMEAHVQVQPLSMGPDASNEDKARRRRAAGRMSVALTIARFFVSDAAVFLDLDDLTGDELATRQGDIDAMLRELVLLNTRLYREALRISRLPEDADPIGPGLMLLELETPAREAGEG